MLLGSGALSLSKLSGFLGVVLFGETRCYSFLCPGLQKVGWRTLPRLSWCAHVLPAQVWERVAGGEGMKQASTAKRKARVTNWCFNGDGSDGICTVSLKKWVKLTAESVFRSTRCRCKVLCVTAQVAHPGKVQLSPKFRLWSVKYRSTGDLSSYAGWFLTLLSCMSECCREHWEWDGTKQACSVLQRKMCSVKLQARKHFCVC